MCCSGCVQIKEGQWYAADGKTKRKSSQYFEVRGALVCRAVYLVLPALRMHMVVLAGRRSRTDLPGACLRKLHDHSCQDASPCSSSVLM